MSSLRQARDVTLGLLRVLDLDRSGSLDAIDLADLSQCVEGLDGNTFVAFASAHFILPALAEPLAIVAAAGAPVCPDLVEFIGDVKRNNINRNQILKSMSATLAGTLNTLGVTPVALKGAAFLATDASEAASWRFMRDIDLLVPPEALAACVEAVRSLGFRAVTTEYDPARDAHFPPLVSPCLTFSVELHTRVFGVEAYGIDCDRLTREATPIHLGDSLLAVPSVVDRIAHLIAHTQLHNRSHITERLVLKDILDLTMLPRDAVLSFARREVAKAFPEASNRQAALALLAAWHACLGLERGSGATDHAAEQWQERALARAAWPRWRRLLQMPIEMASLEAHRLRTEPGHTSLRAAQLRHPSALLSAGRSWVFKQQQRLWS